MNATSHLLSSIPGVQGAYCRGGSDSGPSVKVDLNLVVMVDGIAVAFPERSVWANSPLDDDRKLVECC